MQIEVRELGYTYSEGLPFATTALEDVNFTIPSGEFAAIIGHTGSGKSTSISTRKRRKPGKPAGRSAWCSSIRNISCLRRPF